MHLRIKKTFTFVLFFSLSIFSNLIGQPEISLNRTHLNYGAVQGGVGTGQQNLLISNSGSGSLNWTAFPNQGWITVNPSSGVGATMIYISVDPSGLITGNYTGTVTITEPNAGNSPMIVNISLIVYSNTSPPFGTFETPVDNSTVMSSIPVTGWALDDIGIECVKIYREDGNFVYIGDAVLVDGARPDVESAYPGYPNNYKAGWGYMLLTNFLPNGGNGTYILRAHATDLEGNVTTLGTKTITVNNANAVKPFGLIDTPTQGGFASGTNFIVWGWALTPQPNTIPTDGSTILIWVDGVRLGNPVYNLYRKDIAENFPDYNNSNGAVFYFYLDTTTYPNGVHVIQATVTDNAGNSDGIGARYFTIANTSTSPEIDVQRPASTSIIDGGTDDIGNQNVGTKNLTYTIDNSSGTAQLVVTLATASNLNNCDSFTATGLPLNISAGTSKNLQVSFNVYGVGTFSFDMDILNNDANENPYDIQVSGTVPDTDGDSIPDSKETGDRDGDTIPDKDDFDPTGWIYNETNGDIIPGGTISVSPSTGVNIIFDGSTGYYQFIGTQAGDYTLSYTPPGGFTLSAHCPAQTNTLDPAPTDPNPYVVGQGSKNGTTNKMTNWNCGDNKYCWTFHLEQGDPLVINNNIPLKPQSTNIVLSSFSAEVGQDGILSHWTTETEPNNAGFNIFRSSEENWDYNKINESMIPAQGDATTGATYSYTDKPDQAGDYYYKLQSVSLDGNTTFHGPVSAVLTSVEIKRYAVPDNYSLSQNYPNPFNPETTIEYGLPKSGFVELSIYDINGKLVRTLVSENKRAGNHWIKWDARDESKNPVSSGVYFCFMKSGEFFQTNKMILMK
jgi:hypothetical protein